RNFGTPAPIQATNVIGDGITFPFTGVPNPPPAAPQLAADVAGLIAGGFGSSDIASIVAKFPVRQSPLPPEMRVNGQYGLRGARRFPGRVVARNDGVGGFTNVDRPAGVTFNAATYGFENVPIVPLATTVVAGVTCEVRFPPIAAVDPSPAEGGLTLDEVNQILKQGVE